MSGSSEFASSRDHNYADSGAESGTTPASRALPAAGVSGPAAERDDESKAVSGDPERPTGSIPRVGELPEDAPGARRTTLDRALEAQAPSDASAATREIAATEVITGRRKAAIALRQSSMAQVIEHKNSADTQRDHRKHLEREGFSADDIIEVDLLGESARGGVERPKFDALLDLLGDGEIDTVAFAAHDRIARNLTDTGRLLDIAREKHVTLYVDGQRFDPANENDAFTMAILAAMAELNGRRAARWLSSNRATAVSAARMKIALPSGLVWASPDDPDYVRMLEEQGLSDWLTSIREQQINVERKGWHYYVLPYPSRDVVTCYERIVEWMREHASVEKIVELAKTSSDWPVPGKMPIIRGWMWTRAMRPTWAPATRPRLYAWLNSHGVYGTYAFNVGTVTNPTTRDASNSDAAEVRRGR